MASREYNVAKYSSDTQNALMYPSSEKVQSGGSHVSFYPQKVISNLLGKSAGHPYFSSENNCGMNSSLNNNSSKQYSYLSQSGGNVNSNNLVYNLPSSGIPYYGLTNINTLNGALSNPPPIKVNEHSGCQVQVGGKKHILCSKISLIKSFDNVKLFWKDICPGAVVVYNKHLAKKDIKDKLPIIKEFTKAFCHEVDALNSVIPSEVNKHHKNLLKKLLNVSKMLSKMNLNAKQMMDKITRLHSDRVLKHYHKIVPLYANMKKQKNTNKTRKNKNTNKTRKNNKSNKTSKNNKSKRRKSMKGGSSTLNTVYPTSKPMTLTYSVEGSPGLGGQFANPPPINVMNNCVDNYNHYNKA